MSLFRSEQMGYFNIVLPLQDAWEIMNDLGELPALQFVDQNASDSHFARLYSPIVKRCEEMENKIKNIETVMTTFGKDITRVDDIPKYLKTLRDYMEKNHKLGMTYLSYLEADLNSKLNDLTEQTKTYDTLVQRYNLLIQYKEVLIKTRPHLGNSDFRAKNAAQDEEDKIDHVSSGRDVKFSYLAGVIDRDDSLRFKRIVFRVTRGMTYTVLEDIEKAPEEEKENVHDEAKDDLIASKPKTVFLIVYQSGGHDVLKQKLNKICDSFGASKYSIPEDKNSFDKKLDEVKNQIVEAKNIILATRNQIHTMLKVFSGPWEQDFLPSYIEHVRLTVLKEKSIYHNLNLLKVQQQMLYGYCWCPMEQEERVRLHIQELTKRKPYMANVQFNLQTRPEGSKPPTHFRLNEFTWVFQEIVNTYGIPRYREVNPGLYTIATFPFLFGVMFGDIGHGALLFTFGAYLCWKNDEIKAEKGLLSLLLPARYLLLLMGTFAFYCGFIYNDFMSIPFNLFGSCYDLDGAPNGQMVQKTNVDCVYPFGLDPSWYGSQNELTFFNSLKMKLSVIIGVVHMCFGIFLKSINTIHYSQPLDFFFEFLPQIVFMFCTFVYMDILVFIKWATPWGQPGYPSTADAPSIITLLINMPLKGGSTDGKPLYGDAAGVEQQHVQLILLSIALICVPLMLIPKPIILLIKNSVGNGNRSNGDNQALNEDHSQPLIDKNDEESRPVGTIPKNKFEVEVPAKKPAASGHGGHGHGEFEFGEIFVHQIIETIEFVLGSISNTASYLRLWALSLAHGQLATVFFENTIGAAIVDGSIAMAFIGFFVFSLVTFAVLMCMDVMECFLHALRLHWVEFQNKFYKADGVAFQPFSFEKALEAPPK